MSIENKPPLGIMSEFLWIELRIFDLWEACARYRHAKIKVPVAWIEEILRLEKQLETMDYSQPAKLGSSKIVDSESLSADREQALKLQWHTIQALRTAAKKKSVVKNER